MPRDRIAVDKFEYDRRLSDRFLGFVILWVIFSAAFGASYLAYENELWGWVIFLALLGAGCFAYILNSALVGPAFELRKEDKA